MEDRNIAFPPKPAKFPEPSLPGCSSSSATDQKITTIPRLIPYLPSWFTTDPSSQQLNLSKEEQESIVEEYSQERTSLPVSSENFSLKLFANFYGDAFIKGSPYEGGSIGDTLNFLLPLLEHIPNNIAKVVRPLLSVLQQEDINFSCTRESFLNKHFADVNAYFIDLINRFENLAVGNTLVLPGGYYQHAILFSFSRNEDQTYDLKVINTGEGVDLAHTMIANDRKLKISPVLLFKNLTKEDLFISKETPSPVFLISLLYPCLQRENSKHLSDRLYTTLYSRLKDKEVASTSCCDQYITGQRSGTCSVKSIFALIREYLPLPMYKEYIFRTKYLGLLVFSQTDKIAYILQDSLEGRDYRRLLTEALKDLIRIANKCLQAGFIEEAFIKKTTTFAQQSLIELDLVQQQLLQERSLQVLSINCTKDPSSTVIFQEISPPVRILPVAIYRPTDKPCYFPVEELKERLEECTKQCKIRVADIRNGYQNPLLRAQIQLFADSLPLPGSSIQISQPKHLLQDFAYLLKRYCEEPRERVMLGHERNSYLALFAWIHFLSTLIEEREKIPENIRFSHLLCLARGQHNDTFFLSPGQCYPDPKSLERTRHLYAYFHRAYETSPGVPCLHLTKKFTFSLYQSFDALDHPVIQMLHNHYKKNPHRFDRYYNYKKPENLDLDKIAQLRHLLADLYVEMVNGKIPYTDLIPDYYYHALSSAAKVEAAGTESWFATGREDVVYLQTSVKNSTVTIHPCLQMDYPCHKHPSANFSQSSFEREPPLEKKPNRSSVEAKNTFSPNQNYTFHQSSPLEQRLLHAASAYHSHTRLIELLSWIDQYFDSLECKDIQSLIFQQFFKTSVTTDWTITPSIEQDTLLYPGFRDAFIGFLQKAKISYQTDASSTHLDIALFAFQLGSYLLQFAKEYGANSLATALCQEMQIMDEWLTNPALSDKERQQLHIEKIRFLLSKQYLPIGDVAHPTWHTFPNFDIDLLISWLRVKNNNGHADEFSIRNIETPMWFFLSCLQQEHIVMIEEALPDILRGMGIFLSPDVSATWISDYTFSITESGRKTWHIDWITGTLFHYEKGSISLTGTPYALNHSVQYQEVFGLWRPKTYEYTDKHIYFHCHEQEFRITKSNPYELEKKMGFSHWAQYSSIENTLNIFLANHTTLEWTIPLSLIADHDIWLSSSSAYFTDRKTRHVCYKVDVSATEIEIVKEKDGLHRKVGMLYPQLDRDFEEYIKRFDPDSFVYECFDSGDRFLTFPRYVDNTGTPLRFVVQSDTTLLWSKDLNFMLASPNEATLDYFRNFLLLRSSIDDTELALIPNVPYLHVDNLPYPTLAEGAELDVRHLHTKGREHRLVKNWTSVRKDSPYFYHAIQLGGNHLFQPKNSAEILFSCYIALGQHRYEEAQSFFHQVKTTELREQNILNELKRLSSFSSINESPQAQPLYALITQLMNSLPKKPGTQDSKNREIQGISTNRALYQYLSVMGKLSEREKLSIPKVLAMMPEKKDEVLIHQTQQLMYGRSDIQLLNTPLRRSHEYLLSQHIVSTTLQGMCYSRRRRATPSNSSIPEGLLDLDLFAFDQYAYDVVNNDACPSLLFNLISQVWNDREKRTILQIILQTHWLYTTPANYADYFNKNGLLNLFLLLLQADQAEFLDYATWKEKARETARKSKDGQSRRSVRPKIKANWQDYLYSYVYGFLKEKEFLSFSRENQLYELEKPSYLPSEIPRRYPKSSPNPIPFAYSSSEHIGEKFEEFNDLYKQLSSSIHYKDLQIVRQNLHFDRQHPLESHRDAIEQSKNTLEEDYRGWNTKKQIPLFTREDLNRTISRFREEGPQLSDLIQTREAEILDLAKSAGREPPLVEQLYLASSKHQHVTMPLLIRIYMARDLETLQNINPNLSIEQMKKLFTFLEVYLKECVYYQKFCRLYNTIEILVQTMDQEGIQSTEEAWNQSNKIVIPDVVEQSLLLLETIEQDIDFSPSDHPDFLVFLYVSNILFRKGQCKVIEQLLASNTSHSIHQLIMGYGKTAVVLAVVMARLAITMREKVPLLITPTFQMEVVSATLGNTLKKLDIDLIRLDYRRQDLSIPVIFSILQTLNAILKGAENGQPQVLITDPQFLEILELEYLCVLDRLNLSSNNTEEIPIEELEGLSYKEDLLRHILNIFKHNTIAYGDEIHQLFDINKEVNFPIGEPSPIEHKKIDLVQQLFSILVGGEITLTEEEKTVLNLSNLTENTCTLDDILQLSQNHQRYIGEKYTLLLPKIGDLLGQHFNENPALQAYQSGFIRYITGQMTGRVQLAIKDSSIKAKLTPQEREDFAFINYLRKNLYDSEDIEDRVLADMIALMKHLLTEMLPIVFRKTCNVHFGRNRDSHTPGKVVPFIGPDAPSTNEFGNFLETLCYHYMTALFEGPQEAQIRKLVQTLHKLALTESACLEIPYVSTTSVQKSIQLFDMSPNEALENLDELKERCEQDSSLRLKIERETITWYVQRHPQSLNANATTLNAMLPSLKGLSGTPNHTVPLTFKEPNFHRDSTVVPQILQALLEKETTIHITSADTLSNLVSDCFDMVPEQEQKTSMAIFDAGAFFKDYAAEEIASSIIKKLQEMGREDIRGIVIFIRINNSITADYPVIIDVNTQEQHHLCGTSSEAFKRAGFHPSECFSFCSARQCTGIDLPLPPDMSAIFTWDIEMSMDFFAQALGRLRKLTMLPQRPHILISQLTADKLGKRFTDTLREKNFSDILGLMIEQMVSVQSVQYANDMRKLYKKMLANTVRELIMVKLLDTNLLIDQRLSILAKSHSLMHTHLDDTPYLSYGVLHDWTPILTELEQYRDQLFERYQQIFLDETDTQETLRQELDHILGEAMTKLSFFPTQVSLPVERSCDILKGQLEEGTLEKEIEQQLEKEMEQEKEKEMEVELQIDIEEFRQYQVLTDMIKPVEWEGIEAFFDQLTTGKNMHYISEVLSCELYQRPYGSLFSSQLQLTESFLQPFNTPITIFHKQSRPFTFMVCYQKEEQYYFAVVDQYTAEKIRKQSPENLWIITSDQTLFYGTTFSLEFENSHIAEAFIEFVILATADTVMLRNIPHYFEWYQRNQETAETQALLLNFFSLRAHLNGKKEEMQHLVNENHLKTIVDSYHNHQKTITELFNTSTKITPQMLEQLPLHAIPYLREPSHITQLPPNKVPYLTQDQVVHITPAQVFHLTKDSHIKRISDSLLNQLEFNPELIVDMQRIVERLLPTQLKQLTDPLLLQFIDTVLLEHLSPEQISSIPINTPSLRSTFLHLSEIQYASCSEGQLSYYLSVDPVDDSSMEEKRIDQIRNLSSAETISRLPHHLFKYFTSEQLPKLSNIQISKLTLADLPEPVGEEDMLLQGFSDEQITYITDYQLFKHLPQDRWIHISPTLMETFPLQPTEELARFFLALDEMNYIHCPSEVLNLYLNPNSAIANLPQQCITKLQTLTAVNIIQKLPVQFVQYLTIEQKTKLSKEQKLDPLFSQFLSKEELSALTPSQIQSIAQGVLIQRLPIKSIQHLIKNQICHLSSKQVSEYSTYLGQQSERFFQKFNPAHMPFLPSQQMYHISSPECMRKATFHQLMHVQPKQLSLCTGGQKTFYSLVSTIYALFVLIIVIPLSLGALIVSNKWRQNMLIFAQNGLLRFVQLFQTKVPIRTETAA